MRIKNIITDRHGNTKIIPRASQSNDPQAATTESIFVDISYSRLLKPEGSTEVLICAHNPAKPEEMHPITKSYLQEIQKKVLKQYDPKKLMDFISNTLTGIYTPRFFLR